MPPKNPFPDTILTPQSLTEAQIEKVGAFALLISQRVREEFPEECCNQIQQYMPQVVIAKTVIIVSHLGPIRNNNLIIRTSLYAPEPNDADHFDPVGEIA